jgi:tetratricopeptide (TPR) repeat protein
MTSMRTRCLLILGSLSLLAAPVAWSIPGPTLDDDAGSSPKASSAQSTLAAQAAPSAQDGAVYAAALALIKEGDALGDQSSARDAYAGARAKLQSLVGRSPQLAQAWNSLGYTQRKLGSHADALASYGRALELAPGLPEALEYRGEAYLGLNRIADAKQAYLDLFAGNRKIAATLLESMKAWIRAQRSAHAVDAAIVTDLEQWVQERARIATHTAALTREGAAASWR